MNWHEPPFNLPVNFPASSNRTLVLLLDATSLVGAYVEFVELHWQSQQYPEVCRTKTGMLKVQPL